MKVPCLACGNENELGRIFCANCGKKLDMSQVSMEKVWSEGRRTFRVGLLLKWLGIVILAAAVLAAGLAFWVRAPFQEGFARAGAARVRAQMEGVRTAMRAGGQMTVTFAARDINAYLEDYRARGGLASLTVAIGDGDLIMRAVDELGPWRVGEYEIGPLKYSYEVRCVPAGRHFRVARATVGRLPLAGPAAARVRRKLAGLFADARNERELIRNLVELEFKEDAVMATFHP